MVSTEYAADQFRVEGGQEEPRGFRSHHRRGLVITYKVPQLMEHHLVLMHWGEAILNHDEISVISRHQQAIGAAAGEREGNDMDRAAV